jgi:uncharacterized membrane-anchored protein
MIAVLVPPLAVRATGTTIYLETAPVDPRALFRGDYVVLGYGVGQGAIQPAEAEAAREAGRPIYVTVTTDRPGRLVAVGSVRPEPQPGQACLIGRSRGDGTVDFPQIAQYFVPEGEGRVIEAQRGENLLARVSVSATCNAVLAGLEAR